jgi:Fe-S cluster assembly protein SufD
MSRPLEEYRRAFEAALEGLPGEGAWQAARRAALEAFLAQGFPTTRDEDWKYTSLATVLERDHRPVPPGEASAPHAAGLVEASAVDGLGACRLVFVNGVLDHGLSRGPEESGLTIRALSSALGEPEADAGERLGKVVDLQRYRFAALNTALFADGVIIDVDAGATVGTPVYLLFVGAPGDRELLVQPRVLIDAGRDASVTVIEHYIGADEGSVLTNAVTEVIARDNACVEHYRLQQQPASHFQIGSLTARLDRDGRFVSHGVDIGARLARTDTHVLLPAEGGHVDLNGLYYTQTGQHVDNHTRIDHLAPHTSSNEDYRGVLDGRSRAVFNGKVVVHPDAQRIEAHQSNKNLLLSERCEIDTKPELEIYADDVKCSHGATIGQLDADALFYLLARGIDRETARGLLTFAFAGDVTARFGVPGLRERVESLLLGRLPDADRLKEFV